MFLKTLAILSASFITITTGNWDWEKTGFYIACEVDIHGKVYAIDGEYNMLAFDREKDTLKRISLANYGVDPMIDASNPLELFVFFPNTGKVLWLDNQLNLQSYVDVFNSGIAQVAAFGRSNDGNIWILDNNTRTLKKLNREGAVVVESIWLSEYRTAGDIRKIFDNGESILVQDGEGRIFVFDQNLQLKKTRENEGILLGTDQENIFTSADNKLFSEPMEPTTKSNKDTLYEKADSLEFCRVSHSFILLHHRTGLFLQRK